MERRDMATTDMRRGSAAQVKPGQNGNAGDRPRGTRAALIENFLKALLEDFAANGKTAIREARKRSSVQYLRVIAALVPKSWFGEEPEAEPLPVIVAAPRHEMVRSPHRLR
jgi:hypothetical protein